MKNLPTIEEMLKAGMHFGHRTSKWHPKMKPYIFGSRNGVHIIDLSKSQKMLGAALEHIKGLSKENKTILLVGTKTQVKKQIKKVAIEAGVPYVSEKWLGGFLTNFSVIRKLAKKYKDLLDQKQSGRLDKYTKKERVEIDKEIQKLEIRVGGVADLNKVPDAMFIWDIKTEKTALAEAMKKKIPVIAVCDTNVNPDGVTHIIPANDDATKTIKLILDLVKEAVLEGRAEAAK